MITVAASEETASLRKSWPYYRGFARCPLKERAVNETGHPTDYRAVGLMLA